MKNFTKIEKPDSSILPFFRTFFFARATRSWKNPGSEDKWKINFGRPPSNDLNVVPPPSSTCEGTANNVFTIKKAVSKIEIHKFSQIFMQRRSVNRAPRQKHEKSSFLHSRRCEKVRHNSVPPSKKSIFHDSLIHFTIRKQAKIAKIKLKSLPYSAFKNGAKSGRY